MKKYSRKIRKVKIEKIKYLHLFNFNLIKTENENGLKFFSPFLLHF